MIHPPKKKNTALANEAMDLRKTFMTYNDHSTQQPIPVQLFHNKPKESLYERIL